MKKLLSLLMCLCLILSTFTFVGITASAEETEYTDGYYTYSVIDGKVTIIECDTSISGDITIPSTLGGFPVTRIGNFSFMSCSSLTGITIPNSVTSIGKSAFVNCYSLTSVYISDIISWCKIKFDGVQSTPFFYAKKLYINNKLVTDLVIPGSVTTIGDYAFYNCRSLTSVTIPDSVTSIGDDAFYYCESLTSITIGDGVTSIGKCAFSNCSSLTSITIPNSVTSIGYDAFNCCYSLTNIKVNSNNSNYCSVNGVLFNKNKTELIQYPIGNERTSYSIPNSVTSIGNEAFSECSSLTSVTIGDSVTSIGRYAFAYCESLASITIPDSVTSIGDDAFYYCESLEKVNITDIKSWCEIEFGDNPLSNGCQLYLNGNLLKDDLVIPNGTKNIGYGAFRGCTSLTNITIPNSVTSIGDSAFYNCTSLTSITIPESVTSIGAQAFYNCTSLTSVTIPNSVTSIGYCAFYNCDSLKSITIPNGVTSIGSSAFEECNLLTNIIIGNSVTSVGSYAFHYCGSLTSVTIPASVISIGENAFNRYTKATFYCECNGTYVKDYLSENNFKSVINHSYTVLKYNTSGHWYKCSGCSSTTDTVEHNYSVLKYNTTGHWYKCSDCDSTSTVESHSGGTATCTSKAVCSTCKQSYGSALGHNYKEKVLLSSSCEVVGKKQYTCSKCNDTYEEEISALGHDRVVIEQVPSTILYEGYEIVECSRESCDYSDIIYYDRLTLEYNETYYENGTDDYKIVLDKSGFLVFDFVGDSEKWAINIYDEDGKKVDTLKPVYKSFFKKSYLQAGVGSSVPNENQITALYAGTYYVEIERQDENYNFTGDYQFSIGYYPSSETLVETKYNFYYDAPTAREITLNSTYNGFLGSKFAAYNYSGAEIVTTDSTDAYIFEIPKGSGWAQLSITLSAKSFPPLDSNCTISIYNAEFDLCEDFTPMTVSADSTKNQTTYLYEGIYYIAVDSKQSIEYSFKTEYKPTGTFVCVTHKGKLIETKNPTCTIDGYQLYDCNICRTKYKVVIPAKGHISVIDYAKSATYLTSGLTEGSHCSVCGQVLVAQKVIPKLVKVTVKTPTVKYTGGKKKITIKHTKVTGATSFEVQYKKGNGKWQKATYVLKKNGSKVIKKLKKGNYKIRVRAFVKQNGKTVYSNWTSQKTAKVK